MFVGRYPGLLVLGVLLLACPAWSQVGTDVVQEVSATAETEPVPSEGDAADDACVWIHPTDASLSTIIVTDKEYCLQVCDLDGNTIQLVRDAEFNNVDVRYNFPLGDDCIDLVCATDRTFGTVQAYRVHPIDRTLSRITGTPIVPDGEPYGCALHRDADTGTFHLFLVTLDDVFEQWELTDDGDGGVEGTLVRTIELPSRAEGIVADDELGVFYLGVEDTEIRRYETDPDTGDDFVVVDSVVDGHLAARIEGLTIYYASDETGYLIASSRGRSEFVVYEREGDNAYVMTFETVSTTEVGRASRTDGIDVINIDLGESFPNGMFLAQDQDNGSENQNFKMVPWEAIAESVDPPLTIDTEFNLRLANGGDGTPAAPENLAAEVIPGRVELTWDEPEGDESILLSKVFRDGESIALVEVGAFSDPDPIDGVEHSYEVTAISSAGTEGKPADPVVVVGAADVLVPLLEEFFVIDGRDGLVLRFDEDVSVEGAVFGLRDATDTELLVGEPTVSGSEVRVACAPLVADVGYSLAVDGISDEDGNAAIIRLEFDFTESNRTAELAIEAWIDDAEELLLGEVTLEGRDLEIGEGNGSVATGLRFRGLEVGQGAEIVSAHVQFTADEPGTSTDIVNIHGELSANADYFVEQAFDITGRDRTTETVEWTPDEWLLAEAGEAQQTPDLSAIMEEIVALDDWRPGNAVVFLFTGPGLRIAESYEGLLPAVPVLHVESTEVTTGYTAGGQFRRADVNEDGSLDLVDAIVHLHVLFDSDYSIPCQDIADCNDDGILALDDTIVLLAYLHAGGGVPVETFGQCAIDPTGDELMCDPPEECL